MPGDSTSASKSNGPIGEVAQRRGPRSPAAAARAAALSSQATTSAPIAAQRARRGKPFWPRPTTAKRLPANRSAGKSAHRIFNVASPTSARIIEMIQKRITMVGSAQPFFSK